MSNIDKASPGPKASFLRLSAAVFVTAVFQLIHGWDAAEFGLRLLVTTAVVMIAWRCRSLLPASVRDREVGQLRQRFALRILFWIGMACAIFAALRLG